MTGAKEDIQKVFVVAALFTVAFLANTTIASADWDRHGHDRWDSHRWNNKGWSFHRYEAPSYERVIFSTANAIIRLSFGGRDYHYSRGCFYERRNNTYVIVPAPVGAVVTAIPYDYQPMYVDGRTYYVAQGTYYVPVYNGYQVVPPPTTYVTTAPVYVNPVVTTAYQPSVPMPSTAPTQDQNEFTVNIPNAQGGYTAVLIKRSGNGFVGPQGEFYKEFPKLEQLKVMYVK